MSLTAALRTLTEPDADHGPAWLELATATGFDSWRRDLERSAREMYGLDADDLESFVDALSTGNLPEADEYVPDLYTDAPHCEGEHPLARVATHLVSVRDSDSTSNGQYACTPCAETARSADLVVEAL